MQHSPMTKRRFLGTTTAAMAAIALRAPAATAKKAELNIFSWSEYIPQSVVDAFAKANGVKGEAHRVQATFLDCAWAVHEQAFNARDQFLRIAG